jgi:hypothetical protein
MQTLPEESSSSSPPPPPNYSEISTLISKQATVDQRTYYSTVFHTAFVIPPDVDQNNADDMKRFRDSIYKKRFLICAVFAVILTILGLIPVFITIFTGHFTPEILAVPIGLAGIGALMSWFAWVRYAKIRKTLYIVGTDLFPGEVVPQ